MLKGKLKELREDGTAVIIAQLPVDLVVRRQVREVYIDMIDSRPLSDKQRRMCYSLQRAIADWSGSSPEEVKEAFKLEFWAERVETLADKIFSLSHLDNLECGRRLPSLQLVPALSDVYWEDWETIVQAALNTYYGRTFDPPEKHP